MGRSKDLATGTFTTALDVQGAITSDGLTVDTSDQVIINHSGDAGGLRIDSTNNTNTGSIRFGDVADNYIGGVEYNHSTNALSFYANNATRMTINSSGYVTNPYQPAFNAYRNSSLAISGLTSLVFNTVRSNASSSYNNSTGVFTAPVDGQYLFNHKGLYYNMSTSEFCDLYAYVNGSERTRYEQTGNGGGHVQVDYSEIVYLSANDTFRLYANNRSSGNGFNMYNNENHFSGRLLG